MKVTGSDLDANRIEMMKVRKHSSNELWLAVSILTIKIKGSY